MIHGSRSTYQLHACRCTPCRAANASYEASYRRCRRLGLPLPGSFVPAPEIWRQLRLLVTEYSAKVRMEKGEKVAYGGQAELARRLGFRDRHLQFSRRMIRRETAAKISRIYQLDILEAPYVDNSPTP
jgi:hypothetical protein